MCLIRSKDKISLYNYVEFPKQTKKSGINMWNKVMLYTCIFGEGVTEIRECEQKIHPDKLPSDTRGLGREYWTSVKDTYKTDYLNITKTKQTLTSYLPRSKDTEDSEIN